MDTNIISELMKSNIDSNVGNWIKTIKLSETRISDISWAELYRGYAKLNSGKKKRKILSNLLRIEVVFKRQTLPFDTDCAKSYGELTARNEKRGFAMDAFDSMLLAVAENYDLDIVTRNVKHFKGRTKQLIINPFEA